MIKVTQTVDILEENGKEVSLGKSPCIEVRSHWNHNEWVVLVVGERSITVEADDLEAAIENATNINRF